MGLAPHAVLLRVGRAGFSHALSVEAQCWSESKLLDWRYLLLSRNQFRWELCNLELKDISCIQGITFPLQITSLSFKRFNITERAGFFFPPPPRPSPPPSSFSFWKLPYWCSRNRSLEIRTMACTSDKRIHCSLHRGGRIMSDDKYLFVQQAREC